MFADFWEKYRFGLIACFLGREANLPGLEEMQKMLILWRDELQSGAHSGLVWTPHYHRLRNITDHVAYLHPYLQSLRSFHELNRPLLGDYRGLRRNGTKQLEKHLAASCYPTYGFGYLRSHAYAQAATIGSIFKLVCAYESLRQRYNAGDKSNLNPLTIIDDKHRNYTQKDKENWNVGFTIDGKAIPMFYKGGRLPRSEHANVGKVDLVKALEVSSNPYFGLLTLSLEDPEDLCSAANLLGYGEKTGIELPGEYAGHLPEDLAYNRTGLYATAIGQHSLTECRYRRQ